MSAAATGGDPVAPRSENELKRAEAAIARKYMGRVPWEMVAWGLGNFALWLSIWPLTLTGVLPLWAAFLLLPSAFSAASISETGVSSVR